MAVETAAVIAVEAAGTVVASRVETAAADTIADHFSDENFLPSRRPGGRITPPGHFFN
jgi:hypothetical protein